MGHARAEDTITVRDGPPEGLASRRTTRSPDPPVPDGGIVRPRAIAATMGRTGRSKTEMSQELAVPTDELPLREQLAEVIGVLDRTRHGLARDGPPLRCERKIRRYGLVSGILKAFVATGSIVVVLPAVLHALSAGSGPGPPAAPQKLSAASTTPPEKLIRAQLKKELSGWITVEFPYRLFWWTLTAAPVLIPGARFPTI